MLNASLALILVLAALMALPALLKWMQRKTGLGQAPSEHGAKVLSVVALGQSQRLVTVEAGPPHARVQLELGVTGQSVQCLHSAPLAAPLAGAAPRPGDTPDAIKREAKNSMFTGPQVHMDSMDGVSIGR